MAHTDDVIEEMFKATVRQVAAEFGSESISLGPPLSLKIHRRRSLSDRNYSRRSTPNGFFRESSPRDSDSHSSRGGDSDGPGSNQRSPVKNDENHIPTENGTKDKMSSSQKIRKVENTRIVQVANVAPNTTRDQMQAMFGIIGKIEDLRLYPTVDMGLGVPHTSKICFIKFYDGASVASAQHMTNTVFLDRAMIVIPYMGGDIPDEVKALELLVGGTLLPGIADPKLPQHVTSQLEGIPPMQVVVTRDPKLTENQLPEYPNLSPSFDSRRIEEIRRTLVVANVEPDLSANDILEFFSNAGEVKYLRMCTRDNDPIHFALLEFTEQPSIIPALRLNGTMLGSKQIKVFHATQAIIKPQAKTNEAAQKEIEEAMTHQAHTLLSHGLDAATSKDKRRSRSISRGRHSGRAGIKVKSRSRSRDRRRSRSRSRRRSKRSRSISRSRSKSRGRVRRSRSRGRVRRSPGTPSRRRSNRSRSRERTRRSTSRSHRSKRSSSRKREKKSKRDKDRDKDKERDKDKDKEKDKTKDREGRENGTKSEESSQKSKDGDRDRDRERDRDRDREKEKDKDRDREREKRKIASPSTKSSKDKDKASSPSNPNHEKKKSKSKKKKKDESDREGSIERSRRSRSHGSLEKEKLTS